MLDEDLRFKTLTDAVEHYGIQVLKQGDLHMVTSEDQHKLIGNDVLFQYIIGFTSKLCLRKLFRTFT